MALILRSGHNREHLLHRWRQLDAAARADVHVDENFEARRHFLTSVDTMSLDDEAAAATEETDFHRLGRKCCNCNTTLDYSKYVCKQKKNNYK